MSHNTEEWVSLLLEKPSLESQTEERTLAVWEDGCGHERPVKKVITFAS
jgi:hypothetical protein